MEEKNCYLDYLEKKVTEGKYSERSSRRLREIENEERQLYGLPRLIERSVVAKYFHVSEGVLRKYEKNGTFRVVGIGRVRFYLYDDVRKLVDKLLA